MKLFLVNETEYIFADTEEEAKAHYQEVFEEEPEAAEEKDLSISVHHDEFPNMTAATYLADLERNNAIFPVLAGFSEGE